ncbi:MAG TPA: hypothetical protein PLY78_08385 [Methanospirillum sp.]|nr:hypothetical protein [Methanospirillum sp.]
MIPDLRRQQTMFDSIKKIFRKPHEKPATSFIRLEDLPAWLDSREADCISRRNAASIRSRERLLRLEQDLHQLLTEFGDEPSDEPHHHKVEQVNRHALPQFCKKIEAELEGDFSEDDEIFYREVAGLINGCFKAYRGPGRYLHHLYPEEIKVFKQTLDQMGQELNRMTEIIRISRDHLSEMNALRDLLRERDMLLHEQKQAEEEGKHFESRIDDLENELEKAQADLTNLIASDAYALHLRLEEEVEKLRQELEKTRDTWESQIRIAVPVWKRASKTFEEQGKPVDVKNMEELIHWASSPRRDDDELFSRVVSTAPSLFRLVESGIIQPKNSFEKHLLTTADEYIKKFSDISAHLHTLADALHAKKQERDAGHILEHKDHLTHAIRDAEKLRDELILEEEKRKERLSSLHEKLAENLEKIKQKLSEFTHREMELSF